MHEHLRIVRVTTRVDRDSDTGETLRGIGFRAVADEGWRGPFRVVRQDAVRDLEQRRNELARGG